MKKDTSCLWSNNVIEHRFATSGVFARDNFSSFIFNNKNILVLLFLFMHIKAYWKPLMHIN